jgi:hypothetical protein
MRNSCSAQQDWAPLISRALSASCGVERALCPSLYRTLGNGPLGTIDVATYLAAPSIRHSNDVVQLLVVATGQDESSRPEEH